MARSFWHPLSALILADPPTFATPALLKLLASKGSAGGVYYAGDRMGATLPHGSAVALAPVTEELRAGSVVVACHARVPDVARITSVRQDGYLLQADADPSERFVASRQDVLASVRVPPRRTSQLGRTARRFILDLREALFCKPDQEDFAESVKIKYESQAAFYAAVQGKEIEEELLEDIRRNVPPPARVIVAGSGSGRECFALARAGYKVRGIDFAPAMVEVARQDARRRDLKIEFILADLRAHSEPPACCEAVVFTYDVYSFIPNAAERIDLLRSIGGWLAAEGTVFLSARRVHGWYGHAMLTLQWAAWRRGKRISWGSTHTRWISMDGSLHRSFVQVFPDRVLRREASAAAFTVGPWRGGHAILKRNR